jgi:hypothetical protein
VQSIQQFICMMHNRATSVTAPTQVMVANGSVIDVTPTSQPHLWRALQVGVPHLPANWCLSAGAVAPWLLDPESRSRQAT